MFGAVANLLPHFLGNLLHDDSRDGVTNLFRYLDTNLLGDFLLHIHGILGADRLGKFFAFFSWNIDRKVLATFIRDFFALCSGDLLLHFLRNWEGDILKIINMVTVIPCLQCSFGTYNEKV